MQFVYSFLEDGVVNNSRQNKLDLAPAFTHPTNPKVEKQNRLKRNNQPLQKTRKHRMQIQNVHFHKLVIYFDGTSKSNPRRPSAAGGGWTLRALNGNGADCRYIASGQVYLGYDVSSNRAEYMGLIDGLSYLVENNISCKSLYLRSDSAVVIDQLRGTYNVRSRDIMDCHNDAITLINTIVENYQHDIKCTLISRSKNIDADRLAHYAVYDKCSQTFEH